MKAKLALACIVVSLVSSSAAGQRLDWVDFFHQWTSRDPAIREAAEQKLSSLSTRFGEAEADVLRIDVRAMLPVLDDPDREVRFKVSGLISILALGRQDGSVVLEPAVPVLLAHFEDPDTRVRRNAVYAIINLKPEIPENTLEALQPMLRNDDVEIAAAATHGVTRLALKSPAALDALRDLMKGRDIPLRVRVAAVQTIAVSRSKDPELVGLLGIALEDTNRTLVLEGILAATRLGWVPESLKPQLEKLEMAYPDAEIRAAASTAVKGLDNSR
jgi:HEAT repeat protein